MPSTPGTLIQPPNALRNLQHRAEMAHSGNFCGPGVLLSEYHRVILTCKLLYTFLEQMRPLAHIQFLRLPDIFLPFLASACRSSSTVWTYARMKNMLKRSQRMAQKLVALSLKTALIYSIVHFALRIRFPCVLQRKRAPGMFMSSHER